MDRPLQNGVMQRALLIYYESNVLWQVVVLVLLAAVLHRALSKPKAYKVFPVWATIEIAVASYVLSGKGWGRHV